MPLRILCVILVGVALVFLAMTRNDQKLPSEKPSSPELNHQPASSLPSSPSLEPAIVKTRAARIFAGEMNWDEYRLSEQEVFEYLKNSRTNAASLIAAFELSHDRQFLKKAAELFPNDPLVQATVLAMKEFPEERAKWVEAFKQSAPNNAFPNFVAAHEAMKRDDLDAALKEIHAGRGKFFDDFMLQTMSGIEEAYLTAGRSVVEAKILGTADISIQHLAELKDLARRLSERATEYSKTGATESQKKILQATWELGRVIREAGQGSILMTDRVGLAIQNRMMREWPADAPADEFLNRPISEMQARHKAYLQDLKQSTTLVQNWFPTAPEHEVITYFDRLKTFGEFNAMAWLRNRHPETLTPP